MNIVIATCVRTDLKVAVQTAQWVQFQMALRRAAGSVWGQLTWDVVPGNYIDAQRNFLVECHREAEAILFLDADVKPPPDALARLIDLNVPIAAGLCPIDQNGVPCWNVTDRVGYRPRQEPLPPGPFTVDRAGTACLLIRRALVDALPWPWFLTEIHHATPDDRELLVRSDDEYFCDHARAAGIEIVAHPNVICQHPV